MPATLAVSPLPAAVFTLANGLTLIHQQVSTTDVVAVDVWVKAGAIAEPTAWAGIAHFLEHMIFKGTDRIGPGVFDRTLEHRGGMSNAATSHDYAHFFITATAPHLAVVLPQLADLLLNASIPDSEFWREQNVVLEELHQAWDDPDWLGFQALMEGVYPHHPYGRSVLGTEATVVACSPDQMRRFHRTHYQPENMTIVVIGNIAWDTTLDLIQANFQQFSDRGSCPSAEIYSDLHIREIHRQTFELPRLEQARLMLAWRGPGVDQLRSAYGLDLLSVLLAEGRSSRLVRQLREERGLVEAVSSNFSMQQQSSLFTITAWLEPQYLDRVEALIGDCLSDLSNAPITERELARCQRLLTHDYAFSTETPAQLAGLYGYYNTIAQAELSVTYPHVIKSLQTTELQDIANQYLSPCHYVATILYPAG